MNYLYKLDSQSYASSLPTQFLDAGEDYKKEYEDLFHSKLIEMVNLYNQNDEGFKEIYSLLRFTLLNPIPKEVLVTPDFINFYDFICRVLITSPNSSILCDMLSLIPYIISLNDSTVQIFELRKINEILEMLFQKNDNDITRRIIECISSLVIFTDDLSKYEFIIHYQILHIIAGKSPEMKNSVLKLCSSILRSCTAFYIHRDEIISLGIELFEFKDGNDIDFIPSLSYFLKTKINSKYFKDEKPEVYEQLCSEVFDHFRSQNKINGNIFLCTLSTCISENVDNSCKNPVLQLFYTMIKSIKMSISEILSHIINFQDNIINICRSSPDSYTISLSYNILCYIMRVNSIIIRKLFDQQVISLKIISDNLEKGDFYIRKATLKLSNSMMKYGSLFLETRIFYSVEYIDLIYPFLLSDSMKINLLTLESLKLIATRAEKEGDNRVLTMIHSESMLSMFDDLINKTENDVKIRVFIDQIWSTKICNEY